MAKKKVVPEEIEEVVEQIEDTPVKASKKEEKSQVVPSKEKICEFYGITDGEILDKNNDLSKYELKEGEKAVLEEWAVNTSKELVKDVTFDIYTCGDELRVIIEKYGVTPNHVVNDTMGDLGLSKEEQELVKKYYDSRAVEKRAVLF